MSSSELFHNETSSSFDKLEELEIATLSPSNATDLHFLSGEISLVWPYSSLTSQFSVQLCDSDISKRIAKGQIKLVFEGKSLGRAADELMSSGDKLRIALKGCQVIRGEPVAISEFDSDWICVWEQEALVQVNDNVPRQLILENIVEDDEAHTASSDVEDDEWMATASFPMTPLRATSANISIASSSSAAGAATSNIWFTPPDILRRRERPSSDDSFSSGAFLEFDDDMAGPLRKRSKHSRSSSEWVYDDSGTLQDLDQRILEDERILMTPIAKQTSDTNPAQISSPVVHRIDVTNMPFSSPLEASIPGPLTHGTEPLIPRPTEPAELLQGENELYTNLMRQKVFEESHASPQAQDQSIMDDISIVTQAGSVADQEFVSHEDQDQRSENLEKAQSNLYHEILQAKLRNPESKSGITSSVATIADGFTTSVEGSDGDKSGDDAKPINFAEGPVQMQPHHVIVEDASEPEGEDIIPRYPAIGQQQRGPCPVAESAQEYIDTMHDTQDETSTMELQPVRIVPEMSPPPLRSESEPLAIAQAGNVLESADVDYAMVDISATARNLSQPVLDLTKADSAIPATKEQTVMDMSKEPERSQSLTATEVIDSQRSAAPVTTFSGHQLTLEDVVDTETDIPEVVRNHELPPNPLSLSSMRESNKVQVMSTPVSIYENRKYQQLEQSSSDITGSDGPMEGLRSRFPEVCARSALQTNQEALGVSSCLPQQKEASDSIIKEQPLSETVMSAMSQTKSDFPGSTHPEIAALENEAVDAESIHNTPLIETIMTPLTSRAHLSQDTAPAPFNAFPALENVLDDEVVKEDDIVEVSYIEVTDYAPEDTVIGSVHSKKKTGKLEVIVPKDSITYVEDEVVTTDVEMPTPEEVALEIMADWNPAMVVPTKENLSSEGLTGNEANADKEEVDAATFHVDFETQHPAPLYGQGERLADDDAKLRDEMQALAAQALLQQVVAREQAGEPDNTESTDEEEGFASQAEDVISSPSSSRSDEGMAFAEEEIASDQRHIFLSSSGTPAPPTAQPEIIDIDSDTSEDGREDRMQTGANTEDYGGDADREQVVEPRQEPTEGLEASEINVEVVSNPALEEQTAIKGAAISAVDYALQQLDSSIGQLEAQAESYLKPAEFGPEESPGLHEEQDDDDSYSSSSMLDGDLVGENVDAIDSEEKRLRKLEEGIVDDQTTGNATSVSIDRVLESNSLKEPHIVTVKYFQDESKKGDGKVDVGLNTPVRTISDYPALDLIGFQYLGDFIGAVKSATQIRWTEADDDEPDEKSGGRHCYVYIYIADPSYPRGETLKVYVSRMFEEALPIVHPGDVVLFRNFYVRVLFVHWQEYTNLPRSPCESQTS
ncbi:hypothetical protein V1517DRAFT_135899 [Lipomyces orientalis]|uniref:Uncharacterized protein n=1 Tax=Lipomyces orientalis TaxID=1233043 RepID=A0ACC3TP25_9ASCO